MAMVRYPEPILPAALVVANANAAKPRYDSMTDWTGGARGDDVDTATATVALARQDGAAAESDYAPRTQADRATTLGTTLAVDIARQRGWIAPTDAYPETGGAGTSPAAPVVSSISPTGGAATTLPLTVTITGTGFTPWSVVKTGGSATADVSGTYVNATTMKVAIFKASAGTVSVAVEDHDKLSNTDKVFTVS